MINFRCPKCNEQLSSPDSLSGQTETCPTCAHLAVVPQEKVLNRDNPVGSTEGRERKNDISGIAIAVSIFAAILTLAGVAYFLHRQTADSEPVSKKYRVPLSMTNKLGTMELHIRHCKHMIMAHEFALLRQKKRLGEITSDEWTRMANYRDVLSKVYKTKGILEGLGAVGEGTGILEEAALRRYLTQNLAKENERLKKCKRDRDQMKERIKVYQAKGYDPLIERPAEEGPNP